MIRNRVLVSAAVLGIATLALLAIPAEAVDLPESCRDIAAADPGASDGSYTIFPQDNAMSFSIYCHDMAGSPREYLELVHTGGNFNFAQWGGESVFVPPASVVTTHYTKIRLDPATLLVDIGDETFATSVGTDCCFHGVVVTSVPYGTASDCLSVFSSAGRGNIDLTGTPFGVHKDYGISGFEASGSVNGRFGTDLSFDDQTFTTFPVAAQIVSLTGGGFCGAAHPRPTPAGFPPLNGQGGFILQLEYVGTNTEPPPELLNGRLRFEPIPGSFGRSADTVGCPPFSVGKFLFQATLGNTSDSDLADLSVQVAELSNGNQLLTDEGLLIEEGTFRAPETAGNSDGVLEPLEAVDVSFTVCLGSPSRFRLFVDVRGRVVP